MNRHIRPEFLHNPTAHSFHIIGVIIYGGYHEVDDFEPDPLIPDNLKGPQYRIKLCGRVSGVHMLTKTLQIDGDSIGVLEELFERLGIHGSVGVPEYVQA